MAAQKKEEKPKFETKTVKIGDDTYVIIFDEWTNRFKLTRNNIMLVSSVMLMDCYGCAKQHGAIFE